jgi:hypothetical protein
MAVLLQEGGDRAVAALAALQHGVVSTRQLHGIGLTRGAIEVRVAQGRLHRVHRGVYVVGVPRLTPRGRLWAAVLFSGGTDTAAISHASAADFWQLRRATDDRVDVLTLRAAHGSPAVRAHSSRTLVGARDIVLAPDGLPVTTVTRTLVDLAAVVTSHALERACHEAEFHRLLDVPAVEALLAHGPPGSRKLRAGLRSVADTGPQITRSELENAFLALVARAGLPAPLVNHRVHGYTVDFFWPAHTLVVETDGRAAHATAAAFERDRERDAVLQARGLKVVRFTWRQLRDRPRWIAATIHALAAAAPGLPAPSCAMRRS